MNFPKPLGEKNAPMEAPLIKASKTAIQAGSAGVPPALPAFSVSA